MKSAATIGVAILSTLGTSGPMRPQSGPAAEPEAGRIEVLQLTSKIFDNTRSVRVLLPPGYDDAKNAHRRYPVLYLDDGRTVFLSRTFLVANRVVPLINAGLIPPIIVVGIDNGASTDKATDPHFDYRANEFLPYPDVGFPNHTYRPDPPHPIGKLFPAFVVREVMPLIQRRFRIAAETRNTALGGFSYGAVAALYTVLANPRLFGGLLLESAPLWIGPDRQLLADAAQAKQWPQTVYIGSGTQETPEQDVRAEGNQDEQTLCSIIARNSPQTRLKHYVEEGGVHDASAWGRRLPVALRFLFPSVSR